MLDARFPRVRRNSGDDRCLCASDLASVPERCSAGISVRAYALWIGGSLLFLGHATNIRDPVFTLVQVVNVLSLFTIVVLARRYSGQICELHAQLLRPRDQ